MGRISYRKKYVLIAWALVAPALLLRAFTILYPMVSTAVYSLFDYRMVNDGMQFNHFANYTRMASDMSVRDTLRFTVIFTISSVAIIMVVGVLLALLLNVALMGKKFLRSIVLIPWAAPTIVVGIAAQWAFNDTYGFVNDILSRLSGETVRFAWLVSPIGAQVAVILVDAWKNIPFFAIMVLAGLQSIPGELYESARIDGAGTLRIFRAVTLPHIGKVLVTMGLFFTLWRLTSFDLVYAMTQGGPGSKTSLISYKITTEAFRNLNYGYASAIAMLLFFIMVVIATGGLLLQRKMDE